MKKIEAIVRKTHFEDVKQALFAADINWFGFNPGSQLCAEGVENARAISKVFWIALWSFGLGFGLMKLLHNCSGIRVSARIEEEGLDVYEHGESAYNNWLLINCLVWAIVASAMMAGAAIFYSSCGKNEHGGHRFWVYSDICSDIPPHGKESLALDFYGHTLERKVRHILLQARPREVLYLLCR